MNFAITQISSPRELEFKLPYTDPNYAPPTKTLNDIVLMMAITKGVRKFTPKVKTGCTTCKIRRIKCDEKKPSCLRCIDSGWKCEGYKAASEPLYKICSFRVLSPPPVGSSLSPQPVESRSWSPNPVERYEDQIPTQLDPQEKYYFQVYLNVSNGGFLDHSPFSWKIIAVQDNYSASCIRHVISAFGALIKKKSLRDNFSRGTEAHQFALDQYGKAMRGLIEAINQEVDDTRRIVISGLILACLESFIDYDESVIKHIRFVRELLSDKEVRALLSFANWDDPNEIATAIFFQSDIETLIADAPEEDRALVSMELKNSGFSVPKRFKDLQEVKRYTKRLLSEARKIWSQSMTSQPGSWDYIHPSVSNERNCLIQQIHFLYEGLKPFINQRAMDLSSHPLQRPSSIMLYSTIALIKLTLCLDTPETAADSLLPHFQYIISQCREILEYEANPAAENKMFTLDCRTVGPLFVVATKCRNLDLRRQAIHLLSSRHRRAFIWDSRIISHLASWIIEIEEREQGVAKSIPAERRVWGHSIELDLQRNRALLKCKVGKKAFGEWAEEKIEIPYDVGPESNTVLGNLESSSYSTLSISKNDGQQYRTVGDENPERGSYTI